MSNIPFLIDYKTSTATLSFRFFTFLSLFCEHFELNLFYTPFLETVFSPIFRIDNCNIERDEYSVKIINIIKCSSYAYQFIVTVPPDVIEQDLRTSISRKYYSAIYIQPN